MAGDQRLLPGRQLGVGPFQELRGARLQPGSPVGDVHAGRRLGQFVQLGTFGLQLGDRLRIRDRCSWASTSAMEGRLSIAAAVTLTPARRSQIVQSPVFGAQTRTVRHVHPGYWRGARPLSRPQRGGDDRRPRRLVCGNARRAADRAVQSAFRGRYRLHAFLVAAAGFAAYAIRLRSAGASRRWPPPGLACTRSFMSSHPRRPAASAALKPAASSFPARSAFSPPGAALTQGRP